MCYTPIISLGTAIIEFILAGILLLFFKKSSIRDYSAIILYFLGFYQFSEYMLCIYNNPEIWVRFGFIAYSFLPAFGLDCSLKLLNKRTIKSIFYTYLIPSIYSIMCINSFFVTSSVCNDLFITVNKLYSLDPALNNLLNLIYILYYGLFIVFSGALWYLAYKKEKNKYLKYALMSYVIGVFLLFGTTYLFLSIFPEFGIRFASVFCHFGLFFGVCAFISAYFNEKGLKINLN